MVYFLTIIIPTVLSEGKICILVFPFQVSVPAVPPTAEITKKAEYFISLGKNFQIPLYAVRTQAHTKTKNGCKRSAVSQHLWCKCKGCASSSIALPDCCHEGSKDKP